MQTLRDLFVMFAIKLSKRRSKRQKKYFTNIVSQLLSKIGYKVTIQRVNHGMMNTANVIVGNTKKARIILACGYDDPDKVFWPGYRYYPLDTKPAKKMDMINMVVKSIVLLILAAIAVVVWLTADSVSTYKYLVRAGAIIILLIFVILAIGIRNKNNFSKDGALAILMNCAINNKHNGINDICYVMCDNMATYPMGLNDFIKGFPEVKDKKILYLDRCGSGDTTAVVYSEKMEKFGKELADSLTKTSIYSSKATIGTSGYFQFDGKFCYLCSGWQDDGLFQVKRANSAGDSVVDFEVLDDLALAVEHSINKEISVDID